MTTTMKALDKQEHVTAEVREVLHAAAREARRMNAREIAPEHLFMGVLTHEDAGVAETFSALRLNQRQLREQTVLLFPALNLGEGYEQTLLEQDIVLSQEAQACLEWARFFAAHLQAGHMRPEHVLLGSVRHERLQPLLALLLLNTGDLLPSYLSERSALAYTATMDQLIQARVRRRHVVGLPREAAYRTLSSFERPTLTLGDIEGFNGVKGELQGIISFLKDPRRARLDTRSYLYGLFLVGPAGNSRTMFGKAVAGEAAVPLLSLCIPAMLALAETPGAGHLLPQAMDSRTRANLVRKGREAIHDIFAQAKKVAPCLLYIDELDILIHPEMREVGEAWQNQLRVEMDANDTRPPMVVMATVSRRDQIERLLVALNFEHTAILDDTRMRPLEAGFSTCMACRQEIPSHWKYCAFCGTQTSRVCSKCGTLSPDVRGARFCPECGTTLETDWPAT